MCGLRTRARRRVCVRPRSVRARYASCRSKGWTAARAEARTCEPRARSDRSCCARRRRSANRSAWSSWAAARASGLEALTKIAQLFSAPLDEVAPMVAAQLEAAKAGEKARRKLGLDLAAYQGKELYTTTEPGPDGMRRAVERLDRGNLEDLRAVAQNFTAQTRSVYVATLKDPPSVLLAASADSGVDAGKLLKAALTEAGGRGGGNARIAQGSVPDAAWLDALVAKVSGVWEGQAIIGAARVSPGPR